jgi:phosphate starvation-inducible PhoH-like protein
MSLFHSPRGFDVNPITESQENLAQSIDNNTVVFATGPAGTGKTFVSVALALSALRHGNTGKLLFTRPAVQAGEDLGFLPGELGEKLAPYVRPFDNILGELLTPKRKHNLKEKGHIDYEPLGFLRGQTIDDCWAVLDEAQNATRSQLKMFLTRLGPDAKALVTGDPEQTDLPHPPDSALSDAEGLLSNVNNISFTHFDESDIVRHNVVEGVIKAYRGAAKAETRRRERQQAQTDESDYSPGIGLSR